MTGQEMTINGDGSFTQMYQIGTPFRLSDFLKVSAR